MKQRLRSLFTFAATVVVLFAARSSLADHYVVPTGSMERSILPGDHIVVDKAAFGLRVPFTSRRLSEGEPASRGDVVIFDSPVDGVRLVKRVVGLSGEVVRVHEGRVHINGDPLEEGYADLSRGGGQSLLQRVPEGHVLVLGDARGHALDSRHFGAIPADALYGKVAGIVWRKGPTWRGL